MFGRKKRIAQEKEILTEINTLLEDKAIKPKERKVLAAAKKRLEKDEYFPRVAADISSELRPLALKSELSKNVGKLYLKLIGADSDAAWSGMRFM